MQDLGNIGRLSGKHIANKIERGVHFWRLSWQKLDIRTKHIILLIDTEIFTYSYNEKKLFRLAMINFHKRVFEAFQIQLLQKVFETCHIQLSRKSLGLKIFFIFFFYKSWCYFSHVTFTPECRFYADLTFTNEGKIFALTSNIAKRSAGALSLGASERRLNPSSNTATIITGAEQHRWGGRSKGISFHDAHKRSIFSENCPQKIEGKGKGKVEGRGKTQNAKRLGGNPP